MSGAAGSQSHLFGCPALLPFTAPAELTLNGDNRARMLKPLHLTSIINLDGINEGSVDNMQQTPEEKAREIIDRQLNDAGWDVVGRNEYLWGHSQAVRESLMQGNHESDYLLYIDDKPIAVVEAKRAENPLGNDVADQAESYARSAMSWTRTWSDDAHLVPLVYLANGKKILFKNLLKPDTDYQEIKKMHSPKAMLKQIGKDSAFGKLPLIPKKDLRRCQYDALFILEEKLRNGDKKFLAILATGAGKTFLACLAAYRQLTYLNVGRVLFLVDRNNLGKQAAVEFSKFDLTESGKEMSEIYSVTRLRTEDDIKGRIVISTIQKLYSYMTGGSIIDGNEDEEDEKYYCALDDAGIPVELDDDIKLPRDYFQFIVVDECHRSIYGKWRNVLRYFKDATVLGLTATPTDEAYSFFNRNVVEKYTYDQSVVDGVNVPYDVFLIKTEVTEHGGAVAEGEEYRVTTAADGTTETKITEARVDYGSSSVNRGITVPDQIEKVITAYRESIYTDLYPERDKKWEYIPKTLIFAVDDKHATEIVKTCERVFGPMFANGKVPSGFVQKITYSAGDSDALIQQFRSSKAFRIAVTVTLVSTGTDIKPLEVVMFMTDVKSSVLYEQMKGRGCRTISDSVLRDVTPNADTKAKFVLVDAVGVTASDKSLGERREPGEKKPSLAEVLEYLSHGVMTDQNLFLLRDYCSSINQRFERNKLLKYHLDEYLADFGFLPRTIAATISNAFEKGGLPTYDPIEANRERKRLIQILLQNIPARMKLLEMQRGYGVTVETGDDIIFSGFDTEKVKSYLERFEAYVNGHRDEIEALRLIYNCEVAITMPMLNDLKAKLLAEDTSFSTSRLWSWYRMVDTTGAVGDPGTEVDCLTNIIQLVRYAYHLSDTLVSLTKYANSRFNLYAGQVQNMLSEDQIAVMKQIAEYVASYGLMEIKDLYNINPDAMRQLLQIFASTAKANEEIRRMSSFILKVV